MTAVYRGTHPRTGASILLRSYDSRREPAPEFNCTIWQAGRATCATQLAFKPIQIGQSVFSDEGAGKYNPVAQILEEAGNEWPAREVGVFVSVGTGKRPSNSSVSDHEWWEGFLGGSMGTFAEGRRVSDPLNPPTIGRRRRSNRYTETYRKNRRLRSRAPANAQD